MDRHNIQRLYLHIRNIVLCCYCLNTAFLSTIRDKRSRRLRIERVQQADRNIIFPGRHNTRRMQNFRTEMRQLRRLVKVQLPDRRRIANISRVVVMQPVYIRPNLNFLSINSSTDNRSRVIASSTFQIIDFAKSILANEPLGNEQICIRMLLEQCLQLRLYIIGIRGNIFRNPHEIQRRQQYCRYTLLLQIVIHHAGRHQFALRHHHFLFKNREWPNQKRFNSLKTSI